MISRDFTFKKYKELCRAIVDNNYITLNLYDYFKYYKDHNDPFLHFVIFRHDIDNKVDYDFALKMAEFENSLGISSTYYVRSISNVFNVDLIKEIADLGHEIGYHYEVLNQAKGDILKAIDLFKINLDKIRKIYPVATIAQHGGALGKLTATSLFGILKTMYYLFVKRKDIRIFNNIAIWDKCNISDFGILGDAYISINFNEVIYFSDTGIKWDAFNKRVLDVINTSYYSDKGSLIKSTDDLIEIISQKRIKKIYILTHPANWRDSYFSWIKWKMYQKLRDFGKVTMLKKSR